MMALLGFFAFEANDKEFTKLSTDIEYHYAEVKRIWNTPKYHAVNKKTSSVDIEGRAMVLESGKDPLFMLEIMAELKEEYSLFLGDGRYLGNYIVLGIKKDETVMTNNGVGLSVNFTVSLKRTDGGLLEWIM